MGEVGAPAGIGPPDVEGGITCNRQIMRKIAVAISIRAQCSTDDSDLGAVGGIGQAAEIAVFQSAGLNGRISVKSWLGLPDAERSTVGFVQTAIIGNNPLSGCIGNDRSAMHMYSGVSCRLYIECMSCSQRDGAARTGFVQSGILKKEVRWPPPLDRCW